MQFTLFSVISGRYYYRIFRLGVNFDLQINICYSTNEMNTKTLSFTHTYPKSSNTRVSQKENSDSGYLEATFCILETLLLM
jgi:hypothetical protein